MQNIEPNGFILIREKSFISTAVGERSNLKYVCFYFLNDNSSFFLVNWCF